MYAWMLYPFRFLIGLTHAIYLDAWECVCVYKCVLWLQVKGVNINGEGLFLTSIYPLLLLTPLLLELSIFSKQNFFSTKNSVYVYLWASENLILFNRRFTQLIRKHSIVQNTT